MIRLIDGDALGRYLNDCNYAENAKVGRGREFETMSRVLRCIENAPTVCKWHDPDEELPKKDGEYLCLSPLKSGEWRIDIYRWKQKHFVWTHPKYGEGLVTGMYWWMEIPPMPKMEGEDDDGKADS